MVFELKDQSGVPLDIKVSRDNRTIFEHQTANHATEETVESDNLKLPAGASFSYCFKITWHESALTDAEDTAHGLAAMTENKTTSVNFYFDKPNNGDDGNQTLPPGLDIDGDGTPNWTDENGNGKWDPGEQIDPDIDGDGIPNEQDDDIDGDGIPNDKDETPYGPATPAGTGAGSGLPTTGNTQPIAQRLADTFGKLGEENPILASLLGVAAIVIIGVLVLKRRKADEKN
jgi:LPXTG-motif cell wall-anchored protein